MIPTHFKRYRMHRDLRRKLFDRPPLPTGYMALPWRGELLELHAAAKFASFSNELDAVVFPCLADAKGCRQLMHDIVHRSNFAPQATWLIVRQKSPKDAPLPCATIQGIFDPQRVGSIQNVGVAPDHRGIGLGSLLLYNALHGFQQADQEYATLEVTARNTGAIRLYQRVGFEITRTVYRSAEVVVE
jgi:predicted GNAT family N-acyltransferase